MGFVLVDLSNAENPAPSDLLFVNFWNWRPTLVVIGSLNLIDAERMETMGISGVATRVSEAEARAIGGHLQRTVLPAMSPKSRILLDLSTTAEPDDFKVHQGPDTHKNYGATRTWLEKFAAFCLACRGFEIS